MPNANGIPIIDLSNPLNVLVALILYILVLFLAKEIKRSNVACIMLLAFLTIIAPLVAMTYPLDKLKDRKSSGI